MVRDRRGGPKQTLRKFGLMIVGAAVFLSFFTTVAMARSGKTSPKNSEAPLWKGVSDPSNFKLGAMGGLGILDGTVGLTLLPYVSTKIINRGFVGGEINDQVYAELQLGPTFYYGFTNVFYSLHLRWDFQKDEDWALYALGGLAGDIYRNQFIVFPRVGVGAMLSLTDLIALRAEVSHEFIGVGVMASL